MPKNRRIYRKITALASFFVLALAPLVAFSMATVSAAALPAYRFTKTPDNTSGSSYAYTTATDASGNVFVTGTWLGTVTFDGVGGSDTRTTASLAGYITKYGPNGQYGWTRVFDASASGSNVYPFSVATDKFGNVFVTGQWQGTVVFDGVGGSDSITDPGGFNSFLTKINANGTYGWTKIFDTTDGSSNGASVATDSAGNVYFDGYWNYTVVFDGVGGSDTRTSANSNVFLTKINANGTYGWTKTFDVAAGADGTNAQGLTVDQNNNLYLTGFWSSTTTFDGVGGSDTRTSAQDDAYLTKINANGTYAWTRTFDVSASGASAYGSGTAVDTAGNVYWVGSWNKQITFDGVGGSDTKLTNNTGNNPDAYLTKVDAHGNYQWTKVADITASSTSTAQAYGVALDGAGGVYIAGVWSGSTTFGGSDTFTSSNNNGFLTGYGTDGTYRWTRVTDASGSAMASNNSLAIDRLSGNVYAAGQFGGPVTFDGVGGSDTQSDATFLNGGAFLTSYHVLDASTTQNSAGGDATLTDTGTNIAYIMVAAFVLMVTAVYIRHSHTARH